MLSCWLTGLTASGDPDTVNSYPGKTTENDMQDKQKVTLYLPPELHRQLKIKSAVSSEAMSTLAEKALLFYLTHSDVVEQVEAHGHTYQIYGCPACATSVVVRDGELVALGQQPGVLLGEGELPAMDKVQVGAGSSTNQETLVPC
jgi:hypothetical protein